jgi:hypothetical protein
MGYVPPKVVDDKTWYVEISAMPRVDDKDQRTPEQIQDEHDHDEAVKKYHDEINALEKLREGDMK